MKFAISLVLALSVSSVVSSDVPMRERVLRDAAIAAGLVEPAQLVPEVDADLAAIGERLFASEALSLNGDTSCGSCHLDRFGSADGLRVAVGVGGTGEGDERARSEGAVVPRNTLPLWGRGGPGFETFFWDGKVTVTKDGIFSQFGDEVPSEDPLVVAAHLPVVQIREMLIDDDRVEQEFQTETVESATAVMALIAQRIADDPELGSALAAAQNLTVEDIQYLHIAEALAAFVRSNFRMRDSRFTDFVFEDGPLEGDEVQGGLIYFGKGRCSSCHGGPYLTDFEFHSVPFPQASFGLNGFGVDYGRYNATLAVEDLYLFRTPPLWQVTATAPYGHSGSVDDLRDVIRYHFDPLFAFNANELSEVERVERARSLALWGNQSPQIPVLSETEVDALVAFLETLTFE